MAFALDLLVHPIVQAPMAGGPSTPALAAAVSGAGGLGFLAAGYKSIEAVRGELDQLRSLAPAGVPFGINLFAPPGRGPGAADVAAYADTLRVEAERSGTVLGEPRWDDDRYTEKLDLVCAEHVPVVSFTFGCPSADDVRRLRDAGAAVWVTVTTPDEACAAHATGVDALIAQGVEAGGHRGTFDDARPGDLGVLALLQLVRGAVGDATPLVATGAIATGRAVAAVLAAGATAAQLGTAFMLCREAATAPAHRFAIEDGHESTALTRAFTGRAARGIINRFLREHSQTAPSAYPEVHHLTAPIRAAARQLGDAERLHLWAGQTYPLAEAMPAAELVVQLATEARAALADTARRFRACGQQISGTGAAGYGPVGARTSRRARRGRG
jgi:nitronate monooxygenase